MNELSKKSAIKFVILLGIVSLFADMTYEGARSIMDKRGAAYGTRNSWFGISWFLGNALMGFLYDVSILSLILFSMGIQLVAIPIFIAVNTENQG